MATLTANRIASARSKIAGKLGLPTDADNEQIFAALDARLKPRAARSSAVEAPKNTLDDMLYAVAWGGKHDQAAVEFVTMTAAAPRVPTGAEFEAAMGWA